MKAYRGDYCRAMLPTGTLLTMLVIAVLAMPLLAGAHGGDPSVIHACVGNSLGLTRIVSPNTSCTTYETPLHWSITGPPGPQGEAGPPGPAGPSDVFSIEENDGVDIPTVYTTILSLDIPAGKYIVIANVAVHNLSLYNLPPPTLPVNCVLGSPSEFSVPYSVRIDSFNSQTLEGASTATIALTMPTVLASDGTLTLQCQTNTGPGGKTAWAESRQITAIKVGNLTEFDLAP